VFFTSLFIFIFNKSLLITFSKQTAKNAKKNVKKETVKNAKENIKKKTIKKAKENVKTETVKNRNKNVKKEEEAKETQQPKTLLQMIELFFSSHLANLFTEGMLHIYYLFSQVINLYFIFKQARILLKLHQK
jgi:hypothetical protein